MIEYLLAGVLASQIGALGVAMHKRLQAEAGVEFPRWANAANLIASTVLAVVAAAAAGAALSWPEWQRGAVWAACGGIVGPQVWPSVRSLTLAAIQKRAQ